MTHSTRTSGDPAEPLDILQAALFAMQHILQRTLQDIADAFLILDGESPEGCTMTPIEATVLVEEALEHALALYRSAIRSSNTEQ